MIDRLDVDEGSDDDRLLDFLEAHPHLMKSGRSLTGSSKSFPKDKQHKFYKACGAGDVETVDRLINAKVDVNWCTPTWGYGRRTALMQACVQGQFAVVERLLQEPSLDVNATNVDGATALRSAYLFKKYDCFNALLTREDVDVNIVYKNLDIHETILHACCYWSDMPKIVALLAHPNIDVNVKDKAGDTPLHRALTHPKKVKIINALLNAPNLNLLAVNQAGKTPLDVARYTWRPILYMKTFDFLYGALCEMETLLDIPKEILKLVCEYVCSEKRLI